MKNKIFFVGMPGSGKSTIGKKVAKQLSFDFIDLDTYIEEKEQTSIKEIFAKKGEEHFRNLETTYLKDLATGEDETVISLGGGTPCFNGNMDLICSSGISIYIEANEKTLLNRLENAKSQRPLFWGLTKDEIEQKLIQMIKSRAPYYEKASIKISAIDMNEIDIAEMIRKLQSS